MYFVYGKVHYKWQQCRILKLISASLRKISGNKQFCGQKLSTDNKHGKSIVVSNRIEDSVVVCFGPQ